MKTARPQIIHWLLTHDMSKLSSSLPPREHCTFSFLCVPHVNITFVDVVLAFSVLGARYARRGVRSPNVLQFGRFSTYHVSRATTRGRLPRLAGASVAMWLFDSKVFSTFVFRFTSCVAVIK